MKTILIIIFILLAGPAQADVLYENLSPEQISVLERAQSRTTFDYSVLDVSVEVGDIPDRGWSYPDGRMILRNDVFTPCPRDWKKRRPWHRCPMQVFTHEMAHMVEFLYLSPEQLEEIALVTGYSSWREMSEAHTWPDYFMAAYSDLTLKKAPGSRGWRPDEKVLREIREIVGNPLVGSESP